MSRGTPWDQNIKACRYTYLLLADRGDITKQFEAPFSEAESIRMNQMAFWNNADNAEGHRVAAGALATEMDKVLRAPTGYNCAYEDGYSFENAINDLCAVLTNSSNTVPDLAAKVDAVYKIPGEA